MGHPEESKKLIERLQRQLRLHTIKYDPFHEQLYCKRCKGSWSIQPEYKERHHSGCCLNREEGEQ